MKTRPTRIARTVARRGRFALHPLSFAICLGLSGAAWALPQGGKVVTGDATISKPNTNTEIIRQTTDKAIIDWKSFSIAAGEKVRFYQPSSTSVTLNRVTGYDPSYILGQMSSNGKIFLLNPYGVVFGAGARVDVGGLVVSTLSMANNDFLASRYSLTSVDPVAPAQRGAIVNEGTISAPGGIVVLAGPSVSNTGTIVANGGRVGLVAANSVSIDVEGDGLLFFQTSATEAKNRLEQLGRIQADGGSVELRAAARGAFADTVLNMTGVVQAKTIGTREGKIVIDGGNEGLTAISGQLVASGLAAGEHGGAVTVQGQYFLLDNGSRIEASGDAGGGAIRVGGDFHGANPDIRNAEKTIVMPGAELHADAITRGDGGSLVVWANDWTRYYGNASAKGGAQGGNGGSAEVSGKQSLDYAGFVDTRAPYGAVGTLLMDPANFTIQTAGGDSGTLVLATNVYTDPATVNSNITPTTLVGQLNGASITIDTAAILLAGAGTITVVDPVSWNSASSLTLKADSTITVNAAGGITNAGIGGLNLFTGNGVAGGVVLNGAIQLAGGSLVVADKAGTGRAASFTSGAGGTISTAGGVANVPGGAIDIQTTGAISTRALTTSGGTAVAANGNAAGSVTLDSSAGAITTAGAINAIGGAGVGANRNGGAGGTVAITANGLATVNANVTTTGGAATGAGTRGAGGSVAVQGNGVTVAAGQTLDADDNTITINGGGGAIQLNTSTLTTASNAANAITVRNATTAALGNLTTGATGTTTLGVGGDITGAVTQTAATAITTGALTGNTAGAVTLGLSNAVATLGPFATNGAFTLNDAGGGLNVAGAVTTANNGVASITTTGGDLAVAVGGSIAGAGVSLTTIGANDITLAGSVNGNAGAVTLDSGQAISQVATGTINTTGALVLNAGAAITLDQANTIANLGAVTRGGAFTLNDTTGGLTLTGSVGTDASAVSITTAGGALALGANNIAATTAAGTITLAGVGVTQTTGSITTTGGATTTVNAGTGSIDLQSATNDFTGAVTLSSTGASAAVRDANALTLAAPTLGANTGLTAIAGTTLNVPAGAISTGTGSINLQANGGTLTTPGTLNTTSGSITLVGSTGLTIANDLTTTSGAISLTGGAAGGLTVNTGVSVNAGNNTIIASGGGTAIQLNDSTLTTTSNAANAITVRDATTVALGNLSTGATGTTTLGVAADIAGALTQTTATAINTGTLTASTGGAITLDKANTIANLGAVTRGGAFTLNDTTGGLTLTGSVGTDASAVSITTAGGALALGANNIAATTAAGTITLAGVGVTQTTGSITTTGGATTTVNAGTGSIDLQSASNDFTGAVTLSSTGASAAVRDANALTLAAPTLGANTGLTAIAGTTLTLPLGDINTGTGNLDLRSLGGTLSTPGNLTAANISLTGSAGLALANNLSATNVSLNTTNAAITQPGGIITASGATTFGTGAGAVTLGQSNILNSIGGAGGAVSITEASAGGVALDATNATNLTVTTTQAGAAVTQNAPLIVSGTTTINTTGGGAVTLADGGNNFGSFGASAAAGAVSVADSNAIVLNTITAAALLVNTSAGNGGVTQTAPLNVSGATTINAGSGAITLGAANLLGSFGATGGVVSLSEGSGAIALDDVVAASLTVNTSAVNGVITQTALKALTVTGATSMLAGTGSVTLANAGNDFGSFGATAGAVSVTDSNALALDAINATSLTVNTTNGAVTQNAAAIVTGSTVVATGTGAITLGNAGNDFSNTPGDNSFTGGAISLRDSNALTVTTLTTGPNQSVSVVAGGALNLPASGINTGAGDITLSSGAVLGTPGPLVGSNISLTGALGVGIGSDVTAANNLSLNTTNSAVNQTAGRIVSGGTTTLTAGTGAVTLAQPLDDFNAINVVSGGIVNITDASALTAAANASGTLTIASTGVLSSGGTLAGTNVALTGAGGINLANNVNASGALQLTSANNAINQTAGAITATAGLTTVNAGSGDITLNQAGNDFSNVAGINATGGAVRLRDANALVIAGLVNGANKDLSLTAGTTISGLAGNIDTGSADLAITSGAGFTTFGTLRGTNVTLNGGTGGVSIGNNVTALNDLTLSAANAAITQTAGSISAAGTTTATAGTGNVTLALAGNNFNTFTATANAINVSDDNGLTLGPINTTTLTLNTSAGNGAIAQSGAAVVSGATTITAGTGAVTLTNAGNDFANIGVSGGAVAITDINALALNAINATSLTVDTSAGNGNVSQNAAAIVSGATAVNAGTGTVLLTNAGNNFGSVGAIGSIVTVTDINALALDATNATSLTLTAGGPITQNGAAVISGTTLVNAGANAITLTNAGNNFASIGATGGAVSVTDSNALALDAINATSLTLNTAAGNGNVTQNAAAIVSGATAVNAGTGAVTLTNVGNNFGSVAATGGAVSINDVNALTLGAISATTLAVNTSTGTGPVTQTGAAVVSGASNVNAGTGAVALTNAGNDFSTLGVTGGAISVVDASALTLSSLASAPNQAVNVSAGGLLTLPAAAIDTGTANLSLSSSGALTTVGTLRGTNVALLSGATMTLANDITALGTLGLTTTNAAIQQTGGTIVATGATTVSAGTGNIALAQPTNDFQGALALSGGAITVRDTNNLTLSSLSSGANQPVSIIAGGSLVLPVPPVAIDTGTADLTLQALGGTLAINGPVSGNTVTLTGAAGLTLGANITSSGDQIYTTQVQLSGNVTLDSGASKIDLQGGANGGGNSLALISSNAAANAIHTGDPITNTGGAITNTAQFTVTGNSTLGGNVTTTGNQTYTGPIVLGTDVALAAGAAKIDLQGSVNAANHNLALTSGNAAADAIRAEAAITNAAQFTVTGKSTLASGVSTTGAQSYSDTVTLGSSSNFVGSSLGFGNGIVAGTFDLGLQSDALTLVGAINGSGNAALSSVTQNASVGVAGGAGTYQVSQATLDKFASFGSITVGRADGTGDLTFGNLGMPTDIAVQSASGNANFTGTVASAAGQSRNLTVTTGGTTTFAGAVGGAIGGPAALGNLSVAGATNLNADATTNGSQAFGGPVTVGANATLSATAVSFASSLAVGTQAVTILSDALSLIGPATGSGAGNVTLAPKTASGSIGVAGGAGTLQVSQGLIDTLAGVPTLTLGRGDGTGAVSVGNLVLPADLTITSGSGNVAFAGTVDSAAGPARDLTVGTTGVTSFTGAVGSTRALDALTVSGTTQLGTTVVTGGAQTYTGATTLVADSTLSGPSVNFGSTVDGARSLTVNAAATNFVGAVGGTTALTSLTTDAAGTTQLGGNVTTTGVQAYNDALQLNANAVLTGSTLNLAGSVDGAHTLAVNGSTGVTLGSAIGAGTALSSLSTSGPLQLNAGTVTTTGALSFAGKSTLGAAATLTASSIAFGNTVDGGFGLTLQSAGPSSFAGAVGATAALSSLTANGGGSVQLAGPSIDTTGAQSYSGALLLSGTTRLTGSALALTGAVSGAADLTLQTNALSGGASIAGTGVLTIAPVDPTLSIGVAGGAGALQVSQAVLDGAAGFTGHVIGRSDGGGTVSAGNLVLRADTTLQTASGDLNLGGSVDGAFALALDSGGTTRITGPVGVTTALKSLTTDNNAAAADWNGTTGERTSFDTADSTGGVRIVTTGAQTYNDPVTASVPIAFTGGAITATQATNRFDGAVSANAASLDLRSSVDLLLGGITLQNGGTIETDGVLHLTGALALNGGTLILTSNATPTAIELTDPEFADKSLSFGFVPVKEASATIVQDSGATLASTAGSLLVLRSPAGGSLLLDQPGNTLLGQISAVSGTLGDTNAARFSNATSTITLGLIRIVSSEINVAGAPPTNGDQTATQAGLEGDVIKLTADVLTTGPSGLIRARLPFNNLQGSQTSVPALTFVLSPKALADGGGFGNSSADTFIRVQVGGSEGGFITARPKGVGGNTAVIFLGGDAQVRPFYDGTGKLTEIRVFYNGDAPRTPQEAGALAAVIALIEEARHARFDEAVRTENVSSRLRSGVIAEVGAGRPATVGRESIRLPDTCEIKPKTLRCE